MPSRAEATAYLQTFINTRGRCAYKFGGFCQNFHHWLLFMPLAVNLLPEYSISPPSYRLKNKTFFLFFRTPFPYFITGDLSRSKADKKRLKGAALCRFCTLTKPQDKVPGNAAAGINGLQSASALSQAAKRVNCALAGNIVP